MILNKRGRDGALRCPREDDMRELNVRGGLPGILAQNIVEALGPSACL